MKRVLLVLAAALIAFSLAGCKGGVTDAGSTAYERIQTKLVNMETYQADASVKYISNKNSHIYDTTQYAKISGEYRIEVTGPENVAGNITLSDGKVICQFNTHVTGKISVGTNETQERTELLLTSFVKNYVKSREVSVTVANMQGTDCTVLEAKVPGEHPYLATEKLWVDNKTLKPVQLVVYDSTGGERIVVNYAKFDYNVKLDDNLFIAQ